MKKIISTFLLVCAIGIVPLHAQQEVIIGSGTIENNGMPFTRAAQVATEILYNGSEIGIPGTITAIGWNIKSTPFTGQINASIYMKMSNQTEVTSSTSLNGYTLVYSGDIDCSATGWQNIRLTTPFVYDDPTKNLVFFITSSASDNMYSYSPAFNASSANRKQTYYSSLNSSYPWTPTKTMSQLGRRSNIKLYFQNNLSTIDITKNNTLKIYPNPVKDKLTVLNEENVTSLELYNMAGQKVTSTYSDNKKEISWDLSHIPAGDYIIKMTDRNNSPKSIKIIKE
ncbi:MAG: T9SS type A sorting domain-containing protein [Chryseobacterium sp.]|jgi:hypothetical protein|uniref:T9SS type A sorting domain-containing protein n=1 Tax=Chryseobacterium sp. TaxID=1871047 RepID=UPI00282B0F01|nr:T9SS type A sorting domain-containing protein [Chryseobacterium sp.]MDR2236671.1 T9SS type A sorting domain-containing protein [Chryseobacterium sp.]